MIKSLLQHLSDRSSGKVPAGSKRSGEWPRVRAAHLEKQPACAACGGRKDLQVHHIRPFHLDPSLELDPSNLVTLCESKEHGVNCHLYLGHRGNFQKENTEVLKDAAWSLERLGRK